LALVHADYAQALAIVHHPFAAVWLVAFVIATFWHAQLGLQVVIEDYVHTRWLEILCQLAVRFFCVIGALTGVLAIVRIALG
jgi:succinate dehydrogenase / fumarate reductase, membrane anchor subunit